MGCAQPPANDVIPDVIPAGGGLNPVLTTGAKALFCFAAVTILAVWCENENRPAVPVGYELLW